MLCLQLPQHLHYRKSCREEYNKLYVHKINRKLVSCGANFQMVWIMRGASHDHAQYDES